MYEFAAHIKLIICKNGLNKNIVSVEKKQMLFSSQQRKGNNIRDLSVEEVIRFIIQNYPLEQNTIKINLFPI